VARDRETDIQMAVTTIHFAAVTPHAKYNKEKKLKTKKNRYAQKKMVRSRVCGVHSGKDL